MSKREESRDENKAEAAEEEKIEIRHKITAEETFTLAKDVFDLRCFIKNVYANRAVISRRLNLLSMTVSLLFTLLYVAYLIFGGITGKLGIGAEIALYVLLGVYLALVIIIIVIAACSRGANSKSVRKISHALAFFRLIVRLLSLATTITALSFACAGGEFAASSLAVDVVIIVFSIIVMIFQIVPLIFGGMGKMVRWLLSPVKMKYRFSSVVLEWYELTVTGGITQTKKVSKKYFDDIGRVIDNILLPELGKKYVNSIKPAALLGLAGRTADEDRLLVEGVLKQAFEYAEKCGYVTFNPCKDLNFDGSIEEDVKEKKTMKDRFMGLGKKIGKSVLDKYIASTSDDGE